MAEGRPQQRPKDRRRHTSEEQVKKSGTSKMDAIATQTDEMGPNADEPRLSEDVQNRIGEQLRALYDQIVEEPVPDHLLKLLKRLEAKE